jgi:hypothetical protein
VYRSSVPGHPNCSAASDPLPNLSHSDGQRFLPSSERPDWWGWWSIDLLRRQIDAIFRAAGAAVLEVWTPAALRPEMHPRFRDRLSHNQDCLHFCPSEAVYRTWALMLANMVQAWMLLRPEASAGSAAAKFQHRGGDGLVWSPFDAEAEGGTLHVATGGRFHRPRERV